MATLAVILVPKLLILLNALLKSCYIYRGGEKRECANDSSDSDSNTWILGKGLFAKGFYKYSLGNNAFKAIKGATKFI